MLLPNLKNLTNEIQELDEDGLKWLTEAIAEIERSDEIDIDEKYLVDNKEEEAPTEEEKKVNENNLYAYIKTLSIPKKIKFALFGNAAARNLLIREPNKVICQVVLKNPRIQEKEIIEFAKNPNIDKAIHMIISNNNEWMRNYNMKLNIVMNPKVPPGVSMKWLKYLNIKDVQKIADSRGLPSALVSAAKKVVETKLKGG